MIVFQKASFVGVHIAGKRGAGVILAVIATGVGLAAGKHGVGKNNVGRRNLLILIETDFIDGGDNFLLTLFLHRLFRIKN